MMETIFQRISNFKFSIFEVLCYTLRGSISVAHYTLWSSSKRQMNRYPVDKCQEKVLHYLMDRDLSSG